MNTTTIPDLTGARNKAFFVGILGLVALLYGMTANSDQFFRSYLIGFIYWLLIPVTCNGLLFLHHLVGGKWGVTIRALLETGSRTLPLNLLFAVPILLNLPKLYEWARPEHVAHDHILQQKAAWLNPTFFTVRVLIYFALWIVLGYLLNKWSAEQAAGRTEAETEAAKDKLRNLSGPGLVLHILSMTFAAFDFGMSLEPHWPSTMYGVIYLIGGALSTMAFMILWIKRLSKEEPLRGIVQPSVVQDLGTLMFAFVVLWAYVSFSQFLIIWSGNLPEETPWYFKRKEGMWGVLAIALMALHFALPFFLLLNRTIKKSPLLPVIASFILIMRFCEVSWQIAPAFHETAEASHHFLHWMDVVAPFAVGGIWVGFFIYQLGRRSLVPVEVARLAGGHH